MREIPEFTKNEVQAAIDSLKKGKASDSDRKPSRRHQDMRRHDEGDDKADLQRSDKTK